MNSQIAPKKKNKVNNYIGTGNTYGLSYLCTERSLRERESGSDYYSSIKIVLSKSAITSFSACQARNHLKDILDPTHNQIPFFFFFKKRVLAIHQV